MATSGECGSGKRKPCHKWHWTHEEDDLLTALVRIHGPSKWDHIATHIQGRSGKSCRIRWLNQLHPAVDKTPFSVEEKRRLLLLHREFGNRWSVIVTYFPGRTDNQVKNQYHILVGTRNKKAPGSSSVYGHLENGSIGSSQYQNISMASNECSQFSEVTSLGTNNHGFAPSFSATGPFFNGGGSSSSVYGNGDNSIFTPRPYQRKSHGDSMISDANTAGIQGHNYIDFLGVGRSN